MPPMTDPESKAAKLAEWADQAAGVVQAAWPHRPRFAIILGTGAGVLADRIAQEVVLPYSQLPGFPRSTAIGHKGQLVCGRIEGQPVLAMQGRFHLYEGYAVDEATLPLHVMQRLGVEVLFVSNAAGGVSPDLRRGGLVLLYSHIDLMFRSTPRMTGEVCLGRPGLRSDRAYDPGLLATALQLARQHDIPIRPGVYASMLGPNYETRAEYRMLRRIGADVVGMSTVPEVAVAGALGMRVMGVSIVTNEASPDALGVTTGEEVVDAAALAAPNLERLVSGVIASLSRS